MKSSAPSASHLIPFTLCYRRTLRFFHHSVNSVFKFLRVNLEPVLRSPMEPAALIRR